MKLFRKMKKGFTLVELVVVIAVIAVLAAVSVGAFFGVTESAKASKLEQEAKEIYTAVQIVGNSNSDNHQIDADGLHIVNVQTFEDAINDVTGGNYNVYKEGEPVAGEAIVLKQKAPEAAALAGATTYTSFEYYTEETGKNAGSIDVISGEYTAKTNNEIEINPVYHTAEEVNKAIKDGKTLITFGSSIVFDDSLLVDGADKNVTLDLNGYTASAKYSKGNTHTDGSTTKDIYVLRAINGAKVTITGNGKMQFASDTLEGAAVVAVYDDSVITIKNGHFAPNPITGGTVLYSRGKGIINVEGGTFDPVASYKDKGIDRYFTFNKTCTTNHCTDLTIDGGWADTHEGHCKVQHFNVTGGTFYRTNEGLGSDTLYKNGCKHNFLDPNFNYEIVEGSVLDNNGETIPTWTVNKKA